jgi:hypothetical protein
VYPQSTAADSVRFFKLLRKLLRVGDIDPIFQFAVARQTATQ